MSNDVANMISDTVNRLKGVAITNVADVQRVASEQLLLLAQAADEPGFYEAVEASRDIVALAVGINAVEAADAADQEILGFIAGALSMAAVAMGDHTAG